MFPGTAASAGLSFSKIVGGISKTLGIVNQAIPIYKEFKPVIGSAKSMYNVFKEFSSATSSNDFNTPIKKIDAVLVDRNPQIKKENVSKSTSPIFFQ